MFRLINFVVIGALLGAAAWVYEIKYSSTRKAEGVANLRLEIQNERDAIAALRAEWSQLNNPDRIQMLVRRHLTLKLIQPAQFDSLDRLPDRPIEIVPPGTADPIGAIIQGLEGPADADVVTGGVPSEAGQ
jgi:hypothetical protein